MKKIRKLSIGLISTAATIGLCCAVPLMTMVTKGEETPKVVLDGTTDSSTSTDNSYTSKADFIVDVVTDESDSYYIDQSGNYHGNIAGFSDLGKKKVTDNSSVKLVIPNTIPVEIDGEEKDVIIDEIAYLAWEEFCTYTSITDIDNTYNIPWNIYNDATDTSIFTMSGTGSLGTISALSSSLTAELKAGNKIANFIIPSPVNYGVSSNNNVTFTRYDEIKFTGKKNLLPDTKNNKSLKSMLVSAGVVLIDQENLKNSPIESLYFASGRKSILHIERGAFQGSSQLKKIVFSAGVYLLQGARAFQEALQVNDISIAAENGPLGTNPYVPQFYMVGDDGALYTNEYIYEATIVTTSDTRIIKDNFNKYQQLVYVPSSIGSESSTDKTFDFQNEQNTEIASYAFCGSNIAVLNIPERITYIEQWAFAYSSIQNIYLPPNATYDSNAFQYANNLSVLIAPSPQVYEALSSKFKNNLTYEINISYDADVEIEPDTVLFGNTFYNYRKNSNGVYTSDAYTLPTDSPNWYYGNVEITSENLQSFLSGTLADAEYYSTSSSGTGIMYKNITLTTAPTEQPIVNKTVEAPTFQANVGTAVYGKAMPELTVTFGYPGFNMNNLFSGFDAYRIKYSISGTKALKAFGSEHRIFHVGEYVITLEINDVVKDYTFSGTYNEQIIEEGIQKLQFKIIVKVREVVLPNDGNDILVTSEKELESAIRLFENNYWYDASYSVVQADGTIRTLAAGEYPQADGSYYVRLTLKDNDGNIKWIYGDQTGILTDNEEEINLLINSEPLVAKPILKGEVAGVRETTISFAGENIPVSDLFENYLVKALESTITLNNIEIDYIYNASETAYLVTVSPIGNYIWAGEEAGSVAATAPITYTIYVTPALVAKPQNQQKTVGTSVVPPFEYEISHQNSLFYHVNGYARTIDGPFNQDLPMIGGKYYVEIVLNDTTNSAWEDGSTDPVIVTFTLTQTIAVPSINTAAGAEFFTYKAEVFQYEDLLNNYVDAYSIAIQYQTIDGVSKNVTEVKNAGTYTLTLTLYEGFKWEKSFNGKLGPFTISQKNVTISGLGTYTEFFGKAAGSRTESAESLGYTIRGNIVTDNEFDIHIQFNATSDLLTIGTHTISKNDITVFFAEAIEDNYALTNNITGLIFEVEAVTLDVHFGNTVTHKYDGNTFHPAISFVDGEEQPLNLTLGTDYTLAYSQFVDGVWKSIAYEPVHAGNYKVTVTILNENYLLKDGIVLSREFEITKATITVTGYEHDDTTKWIYDGTKTREFNAIYTGGIAGDSIELKVSLTTSSANAGTYTAPIVQFVYSEEDLTDYTIVTSASANFSITISKASVLVGAVSSLPYKAAAYLESDLNIQMEVQNEATPTPSYTLTYNNVAIGTNLKNAGTYALSITLNDDVNYYFSDGIDDTTEFTFNTNTVLERKTASWNFEITKLGINAKVDPEHNSVEYNAAEQEALVVFKLNSAESNWGDVEVAYTLEYYTEATLQNKINGKPIDVGTYYVKFAIASPDSNNYVLVLLNQSANRKFEITKKNLLISTKEYEQPFNASDSFTGLDGLSITNLPTADTTTADALTVDITTQSTAVGTYSTANATAEVTFSGYNTTNYSVSLAENAYIQLKIIPVSVSVSWIFAGTAISSGHSIVYSGADRTEELTASFQTVSVGKAQLSIAITGQGTNLRNAGTYTLTASFSSSGSVSASNYTLTNNSITFVISPKTISKADLDALTWMNTSVSNRTLISGTYKVGENDVTATNAFAKYRSGTTNIIKLRVPTTMPYNGIESPISYQGNEQADIGSYTATATLKLASTNYAWDSELNPNAAGEVTLTKDWYVAEFTNELKTDFSTDGWIYGSSPEYVLPEAAFDNVTLTYNLSNSEGIEIEDISDLPIWLNAAMPAGSWTLTVCIPAYVEDMEGVQVTYDAADVDFVFTVSPASITLSNASAMNNQTFTHIYNGLPQYIKDVTPEIQLVEPTRNNTGWADTNYDEYYSDASSLELFYSDDLDGTYHNASQTYWLGAPIRVDSYTIYYSISALNHEDFISADNQFTVEITPKEIVPTIASNHTNVTYSEETLSWKYGHKFALSHITITPDELYTIADEQGKGADGKDLVTFKYHFIDEEGTTVTNLQAGTYTLVLEVAADDETQNNNKNYTLGSNGYQIEVVVKKMEITAPEDVQLPYTGEEVEYPVPANAVYEVESYSDEHINVGSYTVTFKIKDTKNYVWLDGENTAVLEIIPAIIDVIVQLPTSMTYTGGAHELRIAFSNAGESYTMVKGTDYTLSYQNSTGVVGTPVNADTYDIVLTLDDNFALGATTLPTGFSKADDSEITGSFTIQKASISISSSVDHDHYYSGTDYDADGMFFKNHYTVVDTLSSGVFPKASEYEIAYLGEDGETVLKDASTYTISYTLKGLGVQNYTISNGDTDSLWTSSIVIQKAQVSFELADTVRTVGYTYNQTAQEAAIKFNNLSGTTAVPTHYEISYKLDGVVSDFKNVGTYEVLVELTTPDTKNFELTGANPTVDMKQAEIKAIVASTAVYKGVGQEPTIRFTWQDNQNLSLTKNTQYSVTYEGAGLDDNNLPKNVNTVGYTVTITIEDDNYTLSNTTFTFKITKAKVTIRDGEYSYVGKTPTIQPVFVNAANPTVLPTQYTIVSYKNADDIEISANEFISVGEYHLYLALTEEDSDNFDLVDDCYIVTIIPQSITSITWYNGATALPSASKTGSITFDNSAKNITAKGTFGDKTVTLSLVVEIVEGQSTILNAGTYKLKASVPQDNPNYTAISNELGSYTLVVTKAIVELGVEDNDVEYDGTEQSASVSFSGATLPTTSDYTIVYSKDGYSSFTGATDAGEYTITVSFAEDGNYAFTGNVLEATDIFTISQAVVSFTVENKVYNGQGQETTISFTWKDNEEITFVKDVDYTVSYEGNALPKNVNANGYTVTVTLISTAAKNYTLDATTAVMKITPKTLSVTGEGTYTEVYGESGTTRSKDLSDVPNLALLGVESGDTVTSRISFQLPGTNATTYNDVSATVTMSGASANNYKLDSSTIDITVVIEKREIAISGTATYEEVYGNPKGATRTYTAEELELALGNVLGKDSTSLTVNLGFTLSDLNVGDSTIQNGDITFTLEDSDTANNYSIGQTNVTINFSIIQAEVKVQFSEPVHTYDDSAYTPTVQLTYGSNNIYHKLPTDYSVAYQMKAGTALTEAPKNVGEYKIVISLGSNYIIEGNDSYEYSIEKCTITVTGIQLSSGETAGWVYDAAIHILEFDAVYTNPVSSNDPEVKVSLTTPSANAGTYSNLTPTLSWSDEDNFDVVVAENAVFSLTIAKAQISLEAVPKSKPYIGYKANTNYYSEDSLKEDIQMSVTNSTVGVPSYTLKYEETKDTYVALGEALKFAGEYPLKLELSDTTNFTFTRSGSLVGDDITFAGTTNNRTAVSWVFEITPAQIQTKIQDSYKKIEYSAQAVDVKMTFKHSDEIEWGNEELMDDIVYSLKYYSDSNRTQEIDAPKNVGTYYVRIEFTRGNYELYAPTAANRVFEITPKTLTITPNEENSFTWVYNAKNDKEFTLGSDTSGATVSGIYSTDDAEVTAKLTATAADVNTYKTSNNSLTIDFTITGDTAENYEIPSELEEFILKITKAEATVVWELKDDVRDNLFDEYHFTYDGKGRINRIIPVITHSATELSEECDKEVKKNNVVVTSMIDAGTYILTAIFDNDNYSLTNETITVYVDRYSISQSELEALVWVNHNASHRQLVSGTYEVAGETVTATNAFTKYRSDSSNIVELYIMNDEMLNEGLAISYVGNEENEKGAYSAVATLSIQTSNYQWAEDVELDSDNHVVIHKAWYIIDFQNGLSTEFEVLGSWIYGNEVIPGTTYVVPVAEYGSTLSYTLSFKEKITTPSFVDLSDWLNQSIPAGSYVLTVTVPQYQGTITEEDGSEVEVTYEAFTVSFDFNVEKADMTVDIVDGSTQTHTYDGKRHVLEDTPTITLPNNQVSSRTGGWANETYDDYYQEEAVVKFDTILDEVYYALEDIHWGTAPINVRYVSGAKSVYKVYYDVEALNYKNYSDENGADHYVLVDITPKTISLEFESNNSVDLTDDTFSWTYGDTIQRGDFVITPVGVVGTPQLSYKYTFENVSNSSEVFTGDTSLAFNRNNLPTNAGTYTVVFTLGNTTANRNYTLDKSYVLNTEIAQKKVAALADQEATYTGEQISYTGIPANAVYAIKEYSEEEVINVGSYIVTFEIKPANQRNYTWDTVDTATLTIVEAELVAVVTNTANVYYDRTNKAGVSVRFRNTAGEAITLPANSYTITYDGLTDKPKYAKEYDVVINLTNPNYVIGSSTTTGFTLEDSRTITGKFIILKARVTVSELDLGADHKHIYNGTDYNADGNFFTTHYSVDNESNSGIIPLEYDGTDGYQVTYNNGTELKNATTYTVKYTLYGASYDNFIIVEDGEELTEWTATVVVETAKIDISVTKSYTYTGNAQNVDVVLTNTSGTTVKPTNALTITYQKGSETEFLNAGTYTVNVTLNALDQNNFELAKDSLTVTMKKAAITVSASKSKYYNAANQEIVLTFSPLSLEKDIDYQVVYEGNLTNNLPLNAGDYPTRIELIGSFADNYTLSGEVETVFKILPARISVAASGTYSYTGEVQSVTTRFSNSLNPTILPTHNATIQYAINGKEVEFLNAGIYTITVELAAEDAANFTLNNSIISTEICKARIVSVNWMPDSDTMVYTGAVQNITATGVWGNNQAIPLEIEVEGDKQLLNAGEYTVVASLKNSNFEDVQEEKNLTISQATVQLSIRNNRVKYDGTKQSATIGFIERLHPSTNGYTVLYSLEEYTDNEGAVDAGEYSLIITLPESGNFKFRNGYTATATFSISPIELRAEIGNVVYNGQPQHANIQLKLDGKLFTSSSVVYTVEYQGENLVNGLPKNVGSYSVVIYSDHIRNYTIVQDSNSTFEIQKATITAQIQGTYSYTGSKQDVEVVFKNALNDNVLPTEYVISYQKNTETDFLNIGTYSIDIALVNNDALNFNLIEAEYEATINKATISSVEWVGISNLVYTGQVHEVNAVAKWGSNQSIDLVVRVAEDKEILNVGTYVLEVSYSDPNFESLTETKTIVVKPAIVSANITNNHYVYDGEEKSATIELVGDLMPEEYSISYELDDYISSTGATHAGTYTIVISLEENGNFSFEDGYTTTRILTIDRVTIDVDVTFGSYTGAPQKANISFSLINSTPQNVSYRIGLSSRSNSLDFVEGVDYIVEYTGEGLVDGLPKNAGKYFVAITFISENATNYVISGSTDGVYRKEFSLAKAKLHLLWSEELEFADDSEIRTPFIMDESYKDLIIVIYKDANGNILDSAPEVGGEYTVEIQLKDPSNYELIGEVSKTFNIIPVNQADLTIYLCIIFILLAIIVLLIIVIIMLLRRNRKDEKEPIIIVSDGKKEEPVSDEEPKEEVVNVDTPVEEDTVEPEEEDDDDEEEDEPEIEEETEEKPTLTLEEIESIIQSYRDKYFEEWDKHAKDELNEKYDELMKGLDYYQRKERRTFRDRINKATPEVKGIFNQVKDEFMQYEGVTNRLTKYYDVFYIGRKKIAKISLTNKKIKVYLAADPEKYPENSFPHKNLSDKKSHAGTPYYALVKSQLSIRRVGKVFADIMETEGKTKKENYQPIDHAIKYRFLSQSQNQTQKVE